MPKIRALKPSFFTDEAVVEVSPLARLLFQGLWCYACDNGHLEDKPRQIKLRVLPADDCDVDDLLHELTAQGLILREDGWITIPTLIEHQRPDKRYFLRCERPGCGEAAASQSSLAGVRFGNHRRWHEARDVLNGVLAGLTEAGLDRVMGYALAIASLVVAPADSRRLRAA